MNNGVYYGNGNILGYDRIEQILPDKTKLVDFVINPELARLSKKIDGYVEMRAEGDLSREAFRMKCAELEPRMQQLQKEIETLSAEAAPKEVVDYTQKLTVLQYALEQYTNRDEGHDVPESVIEAFVVKIVVSKDGFDWYLRFDGDPDKPLRCKLEGKRRSTTKIVVTQDFSPALDSSTTGCYQGLILGNQPYIKRVPPQGGTLILYLEI